MKKLLGIAVFLIAIVMANLAFAATIRVESPAFIVENEDVLVHAVVNSTSAFSGSLQFSYTNINSQTSSVSFSDSNFFGGIYNYSWTVKGAAPGAFSIYANALNSSSESLAVYNKTGTSNSSMPTVLSSGPFGMISKDNTILVLKTSEISVCRLDTSDVSYGSMSSTFGNTNALNHNHTLSGLGEGEKIYYIRCQDTAGYSMNSSHQIKFTVDMPPTAEIKLSDETPVKAGTLAVELAVSESVDSPSLQYELDDGAGKKTIPLTGSGKTWKGYLVIGDEKNGRVGTFHFSAVDNAGSTGTKITKNGIFVIDTQKPNAPQSIKAVSEDNGRIRVTWHYDGEEADGYKVYRSTSSGVNYVDYYADSNGSASYTDRAVSDKVTYYYKVSAVDNAGNEGPLSEEAYATSLRPGSVSAILENTAVPAVSAPKLLPPQLIPYVEDQVKQIESLTISVDEIINGISSLDLQASKLASDLKIKEGLVSAKSSLESLRSRADSLRLSYATETELLKKIEDIRIEVRRIEKSTPKKAEVTGKADFSQVYSNEDVLSSMNMVFPGVFDENAKEKYLKQAAKEQERVSIDASVSTYRITYLDGSASDKSAVVKKIKYDNEKRPNDVIIVETIPKSVAQTASEVSFASQLYEVLEDDPVIKFGFVDFSEEGEEIKYYLDKKINPEDVKNSKTVFLLSPNSFAVADSKVTGNSVFSFNASSFGSVQNTLVWIGATLVLGLFGYYYIFVKDSGYNLTKMKRAMTIRKLEGDAESDEFRKRISGKDSDEMLDELSGHIKDVDADMAQKLLPLIVALNSKVSEKKKSAAADYETMLVNTMIDQAHAYLDNNLHNEAVKIYPRISQLYNSMEKGKRTEIFPRCSHLHRRIHLRKPMK